MLQEIMTWSEKLAQGLDLAHNFHYEHRAELAAKQYNKIVFIGMGGSGVAGRIMQTFLDKQSRIPSFVVDYPELPAFIDNQTLAFVMSYSGNTWETLACLDQLIEKKVPTVVLSNGGKALQQAQELNLYSVIVPQTSAPRAALGYFLGFYCGLFDLLGFLPGINMCKGFAEHANRYATKFSQRESFSDFLAAAKDSDFFHLWGVRGDSGASMYRAQTQFNENSKVHAVSSQFPELCHNLIVGFTDLRQKALVIVGSTDFLLPKLTRTVSITSEILEEQGVSLYKVPVFGDNWEDQLFHIILWADFASYYLGVDRGVDITAVRLIDELKTRIAQKGN